MGMDLAQHLGILRYSLGSKAVKWKLLNPSYFGSIPHYIDGDQIVIEEDVESLGPQVVGPDRTVTKLEREENTFGICCALVGCLFCWIPIIGVVTFVFCARASRNTTRYQLAFLALTISFLMIFLGILLGILYR